MAWKRLPNNYGTVYKLSGNRRRPFIARKRVGESHDDELKVSKPIYVTIGYFETKKEALSALANTPDNITKEDRLTFGEVFDLWKKDKYGDDDLPHSYVSPVRYLDPIRQKKIDTFRAIDIETFINDPKMPRTIKHFVKVLMNQTFSYAERHDIIEKNYCALAKPKIDVAVKAKKAVFTASEIKDIWNMEQTEKRDIVLILLYSGMRVNECMKLRVENVNMDEHYMVTGSKTEAGKDRIIPIHDRIYPIMQHWMSRTRGKLFHMTDHTVRMYMVDEMGHSPHECRHTFATQAMECGMNDEARKRILGHASVGVTNKTYTHLDIEFLRAEMAKLKY